MVVVGEEEKGEGGWGNKRIEGKERVGGDLPELAEEGKKVNLVSDPVRHSDLVPGAPITPSTAWPVASPSPQTPC